MTSHEFTYINPYKLLKFSIEIEFLQISIYLILKIIEQKVKNGEMTLAFFYLEENALVVQNSKIIYLTEMPYHRNFYLSSEKKIEKQMGLWRHISTKNSLISIPNYLMHFTIV